MDTTDRAASNKRREGYGAMSETYEPLRDFNHAENLQSKWERVTGLEALLATHEASNDPDYSYLLELKERIRRARVQLQYMRP
jgi:hypothetical protein